MHCRYGCDDPDCILQRIQLGSLMKSRAHLDRAQYCHAVDDDSCHAAFKPKACVEGPYSVHDICLAASSRSEACGVKGYAGDSDPRCKPWRDAADVVGGPSRKLHPDWEPGFVVNIDDFMRELRKELKNSNNNNNQDDADDGRQNDQNLWQQVQVQRMHPEKKALALS